MPSVGLRDRADDREPRPLDPPRSLEPRKKRSKTLSRSSSRDPGAVVLDREHDVAVARSTLRLDRRAGSVWRSAFSIRLRISRCSSSRAPRTTIPGGRGDRDLVVAGDRLELGRRVGRRPRRGRPARGRSRGPRRRARAAAGRRPGGACGARSAARRRRPRAARRRAPPRAARGWRAPRSAACAARARRRRRTRAGGQRRLGLARASPSAASIDSSVRASSATSSSDSGRGIRTVGSRERSTSRAAAVSSAIGSIARRAVARPASSASSEPPSTPKARNTFTRFAVACTSESRRAYWMITGSA